MIACFFFCFIFCNSFFIFSILLFVLWCMSFNSEWLLPTFFYFLFHCFNLFLCIITFVYEFLIFCFPLPCYFLLNFLSIPTAYVWNFVVMFVSFSFVIVTSGSYWSFVLCSFKSSIISYSSVLLGFISCFIFSSLLLIVSIICVCSMLCFPIFSLALWVCVCVPF